MPPRKQPAAVKSYSDFIQPFLIDRSAIRGRLVRVETSLNTILAAHNYPPPVSLHLAEQIVLAALLSATLSGDGILTVQAKGDGPVRFIVVEVLGKGYLAVTLDPGGDEQRYQGIVELTGDSLSDAFRGYFIQSQQAEVMVQVAVRPPDKKHPSWRAGGIIIERVPVEGGKESEFTREEQDELWERTGLFMNTLKEAEMLDPGVTPQNLLYRLFNEDGVWVTRVQPLKSGCRCSRERVRRVLKSLPKEELISALDNGKLTIHCQFCNKREAFTRADINRLFARKAKR
jgi:molecular chaperone Hsp33